MHPKSNQEAQNTYKKNFPDMLTELFQKYGIGIYLIIRECKNVLISKNLVIPRPCKYSTRCTPLTVIIEILPYF